MTRKLKAHEKNKDYRYKIVKGKKLKPILYDGKLAGFGKLMAGVFLDSNEVVRDSKGKVIPYKQIVESDEN
jgi:hypothetical protein